MIFEKERGRCILRNHRLLYPKKEQDSINRVNNLIRWRWKMRRTFGLCLELFIIRRIKIFISFLLPASLILLIPPSPAYASRPGWGMAKAPLISPAEAGTVTEAAGEERILEVGLGTETEMTPEIQELARALQHDPKLIYEFVRNHIQYVPYYGCLKGATLTLIERSGNDFDQAALMIALLRISGYTAQFVSGTMTIPNFGDADHYDMQHWLGVDADSSVISQVLGAGGIPASVYVYTTVVDRVWVKATVDGTDYIFDAAFKPCEEIEGINLESTSGYDRSALLAAAGGEVGADYVRNLNESGLNAKIAEYTENLISFLCAHNPNASVDEILGARKIVPEYLESLPTSLRFSNTPQEYWDDVPQEKLHTLTIQHGAIDEEFPIPHIAGKKVAITYDTGEGAGAPKEEGTDPGESPGIEFSPVRIMKSSEIEMPSTSLPGVESAETQAPRSGTWDFGRVPVGSFCQSDPVEITNQNSVTIQLHIQLSSNPTGAYSLPSGAGWHTLSPGQSASFSIRFTAQEPTGTKTGELQIRWYYNGEMFSDDRTVLMGVAAHAPDLFGHGMDFAQCYLGQTKEGACQLGNNGPLALTIDGISITGADAARYNIAGGGEAGTIPSGGYRDIDVEYLADVLGVHENAHVLVECTYDGVVYHGENGIKLPLCGETLPLPNAKLWIEDAVEVEGPAADTMVLSVNHPYAAQGGGHCDQSVEYKLKPGDSTYVILSGFGGSQDGELLKKRQRLLSQYREQGFADDSREVMTEALNVMGQTWMEETTLDERILSKLNKILPIRHHRFGVMAQEEGYYIDIKAQYSSYVSRTGNSGDEKSFFKAMGFLASAMEHGVLEQLQMDRPAASTVKLLQLANSGGHKIFKAYQSNYASIEPQFTGYSPQDLQEFQSDVNSGATLYLPAYGQLGYGEWYGKGYIRYYTSGSVSELGMIIGGDYNGGYGFTTGTFDVPALTKNTNSNITPNQNANKNPTGADPVDMVTGAVKSNYTDLALGGGPPLGMALGRSYNGTNHFRKTSLGYGWRHNYDIVAEVISDGESGLGMRKPIDCAALLVVSLASLDLMEDEPGVLEWTVGSLMAKWAMDRLSYNGVSIYLNDIALTFIKLPDGAYSSPPGITAELIKDGNQYRIEKRYDETLYFDAENRISSWVDADGNTMSFSYSGDKLDTVQDTFGRTLTLAYSGSLLDSVTDSTGRSVSYEYDGDENLTGFRDTENMFWSYGYDGEHRMTTVTNPLNITTATSVYDTLGRVKTQTSPRQGGASATYTYYFSGFRNIQEDPEGHETIFHMDKQGRTLAEENALGYRTTREYDGQEHVVKTVNPRNNPTFFKYDGDNNLTGVTNALGNKILMVYDAQFRKTDEYDPLDHRVHYDYDAEHHLTGTIVYPQVGKEIETTSTYYTNGLVHTTTDGRDITTTLTYDAFGNMDTSQTGTQPLLDCDSDAIGRMVRLTDQAAAETTFDYDDRGLLESKTDPLLKDTVYTYYDDGSVHTVTDRNGVVTAFTYTPSGNVETVTLTESGETAPTLEVSYGYDILDNLRTMQDSVGTTLYDYDAVGRITSVTDPHGFEVAYGYDEAGNLATLTYPGNKTVTYTYDALNRPETVSIDWLGRTATYHYDDANRVTGLDQFNNTKASFGYDDANRLTSLENRKDDLSPIAVYSFVLDDNGNRTDVDYWEPLLPMVSGATVAYTYNEKKNRLASSNGISYTYDDEGQLTNADGIPYTFDAAHRLVAIGGSHPCEYVYDGKDNRLQASRNGVVTRYIYSASGQLLAEADENNNIKRYFIYGKGLTAMVTASGEIYCYHFDASANTIAMTDSSGNIANSYAYTPFGLIANEQESVTNPFKFVGQFGVMTEPNGFYYMKARYYDPGVGRFISEDPLGFEGGDFNLYQYAHANPVIFMDPLGLCRTHSTIDPHYASLSSMMSSANKPIPQKIKVNIPTINISFPEDALTKIGAGITIVEANVPLVLLAPEMGPIGIIPGVVGVGGIGLGAWIAWGGLSKVEINVGWNN